MQRYTVYFIWKLLYMFRVVPPPIIRSANNCIYSIWHLSTVTATCRYRGRVGTHVSGGTSTRHQERKHAFQLLFYLETALHVSGGTTTHHQERIQLYLQYLVFDTTLLLSAAIVEGLERSSDFSTIGAGSSNGVTNTRCCRYSCLPS